MWVACPPPPPAPSPQTLSRIAAHVSSTVKYMSAAYCHWLTTGWLLKLLGVDVTVVLASDSAAPRSPWSPVDPGSHATRHSDPLVPLGVRRAALGGGGSECGVVDGDGDGDGSSCGKGFCGDGGGALAEQAFTTQGRRQGHAAPSHPAATLQGSPDPGDVGEVRSQ